jgi:hypothetical protein
MNQECRELKKLEKTKLNNLFLKEINKSQAKSLKILNKYNINLENKGSQLQLVEKVNETNGKKLKKDIK